MLFIFLKVFNGNTDRHSIVYHQFTRPFTAIHVRFYPRTWYSWISMRAEVYGCSGIFEMTMNICYSPPGRSVLGKAVPEAVLEIEGTVFPNTDLPRPVNNIFIYF